MRLIKVLGQWLLVASSYAQMAMASSSSPDHGINWWGLGSEYKDSPALGWLSITFVIFVYFVSRAVKKPLSLYLETRSKDIRRQIEEGRQAKIESEQKLKLYDEKLRSLGDEVDKMKRAFAEQAELEKIERARLAKETQARILRDADDTIRANIERAKNRLAKDAINDAIRMAEKAIAEKQRDEVDQFLQKGFVDDLRGTASEIKRDYVVNEFVKSAINKNDMDASAREVH
jgi:F0F1-type ATP synthase membrane subunit b/b'